MHASPQIAVVGAGLGGVCAAHLLHQAGYKVKLYEQAPALAPLGAGIHLGPNLMKVIRHIGLEQQVVDMGSQPDAWYSRDGKTSEIIATIPLGEYALERYGANYLTVHRGNFHALLVNTLPQGMLSLGKHLTGIEDLGEEVRLSFKDGTIDTADLVVGADGVYSRIREVLLGSEPLTATGYVGHRMMIPVSRLKSFTHAACTKWWAEDRHMMVYFLDEKRDAIYCVTGVPEGDAWDMSKPWVPSSREELRTAFEGWHPYAMEMIEGAENVTKWPFFEREAQPLWSRGRIVILGDACHPMKPHMAQGAAMAIEDAAVLTRSLQETGTDKYRRAFEMFQANRQDRVRKVQTVSHNNTWLRSNEDPEWCFGYDAVTVPLRQPREPAGASA